MPPRTNQRTDDEVTPTLTMPLTKLGARVKGEFKKKYGDKADEVFYASMNKGTLDRSKMEGKKKKKAAS